MRGSEQSNGFTEEQGLHCVSEGISAYLEELDSYRAICNRSEGKAGVSEQGGELRVFRFFAFRSALLAQLRAAVQQLPPSQVISAEPRNAKAKEWRTTDPSVPSTARHFRCSIAWDERLFLMCARTIKGSTFLQVELHVRHSCRDLPESPLRLLAQTLRCHEFLIPEVMASPLPVPSEQQAELLGLREYLLRATPPNLAASQCI